MGRLEATRMIRGMAAYKNLPILAMTTNVFEEDRQVCMEAGQKTAGPVYGTGRGLVCRCQNF